LNDFCEEALNGKNILNECTKYCPKDCIHFDIQLSETKYYYFEEKTEEFTEEMVQMFANKLFMSYTFKTITRIFLSP
jgi:hypothetical protein